LLYMGVKPLIPREPQRLRMFGNREG